MIVFPKSISDARVLVRLLRRGGSETEAWTDRTPCEIVSGETGSRGKLGSVRISTRRERLVRGRKKRKLKKGFTRARRSIYCSHDITKAGTDPSKQCSICCLRKPRHTAAPSRRQRPRATACPRADSSPSGRSRPALRAQQRQRKSRPQGEHHGNQTNKHLEVRLPQLNAAEANQNDLVPSVCICLTSLTKGKIINWKELDIEVLRAFCIDVDDIQEAASLLDSLNNLANDEEKRAEEDPGSFTCLSYMSLLHVSVTCLSYMFFLHVSLICLSYMSLLYVSLTCLCYMSLLHVSITCLSYMSPLHLSLICLSYVSPLHVSLICLPYVSLLHVSLLCLSYMSLLFVSLTCLSYMSLLHVSLVCLSYMSLWFKTKLFTLTCLEFNLVTVLFLSLKWTCSPNLFWNSACFFNASFIKGSWEAILPCYGQIEFWDLKWWRVVREWDLTLMKGGVRLYTTLQYIRKELTLMKGGVRLYIT